MALKNKIIDFYLVWSQSQFYLYVLVIAYLHLRQYTYIWIHMTANGQYSSAMKFYMEAGVVASDFFSSAVPKSIYEDQVR